MRVAIVGSREIGEFKLDDMLAQIPENTTEIVSGGAVGIDTLAERASKILSVPLKVFLPDYTTHGRTAPLIRNRQIVEYADYVIAFWDYYSRGTAHTLQYCIETGKPFRIFPILSKKEKNG